MLLIYYLKKVWGLCRAHAYFIFPQTIVQGVDQPTGDSALQCRSVVMMISMLVLQEWGFLVTVYS